jgi:hypothetical protein
MSVVYPKTGTTATVIGLSALTIPATQGMCKQIFIKAATSTTTFDVKLIDRFSLDVLHETNITGLLNQLIELPCYGNWTLSISNASADENFTYLIVIKEN